MNRVITKFAIGILVFFLNKSHAQQWEPVTTLPDIEFTSIQKLNNKIYATAENKLFISSDGTNWQSEIIHPISITPTCMTIFNNILYVGTMENGIYYRNIAAGSSWSHALLGLNISTFLVHDGMLHICSQGSGVWKNISGTWNNLTSNLPIYSYNVTKIISINGNLLALAGANGTFYRYDETSLKWIEDYYSNSYQPGLIIDDAITNNETILAANGHHLIRSEDNGNNWTSDDIGLINGINRILFKGVNYVYALTLNPTNNFTHFQKRISNANSGTSWGDFNEELPFYTYAITEFNGKIYAASNKGVFVKSDSALGIDNPIIKNPEIIIYPSPSIDGNINVKSDFPIDYLEVYDLNGIKIISKSGSASNETISISGKGIYLVKIESNGQIITKKAILQ